MRKTAFVTTEGFRDILEQGYEKSRFDHYDLMIDSRAPPLVTRKLRLTVNGAASAWTATVRWPLDEDSTLPALAEKLLAREDQSGGHRPSSMLTPMTPMSVRVRDYPGTGRPRAWIALSSDVCPEIREYERISTACANAYVSL